MEEKTNVELYGDWIKAKKAETKAKEKRKEIEDQILPILPTFKGMSKTLHIDGYKLEIKKTGTYKFKESWRQERENIPEHLRPEKFEVATAGLTYLKENEKEIYKLVSDNITYTPGRTGYKIEKENK